MDERHLPFSATSVAGRDSDALPGAVRRLRSVEATSAELGLESVAARAALLRRLLDRLLVPTTADVEPPTPLG